MDAVGGGLLEPLGLAALGTLVVLVWLHARNSRVRSMEVGSLLLWQVVPESEVRSRFRPGVLFWLQALVLIALALALAGPFVERAPEVVREQVAIVIDASASMQTLEADGVTRFERARSRAAAEVDALGSGVPASIVVASEKPEILVAPTTARGLLHDGLAALAPRASSGRLGLAVRQARLLVGGSRHRLVVLTDEPRSALPLEAVAGETLVHVRFGRSDDNVAIAGLEGSGTILGGSGTALRVTVQNYSSRSRRVEVHAALATTPLGQPAHLGQPRHLGQHSVDLAPRGQASVSFDQLPRLTGTLRVWVEPGDALALDDEARVRHLGAAQPKVVLFTADPDVGRNFERLGRALGAAIEVRAPEPRSSDATADVDVTILHRVVAPAERPRALLVIDPPPGDTLAAAAGPPVRDARILDWDETHPLLDHVSYLDASVVTVAQQLRTPSWILPLVTSRTDAGEFPLLLAGERDGRRLVVFSFDVGTQAFRPNEDLGPLVLLLNSIRWLAGSPAGHAAFVPLGAAESDVGRSGESEEEVEERGAEAGPGVGIRASDDVTTSLTRWLLLAALVLLVGEWWFGVLRLRAMETA